MKTDQMIFVFGSNMGGIHGAGAARFAFEYRGALIGVAYGLTGNSFAIPTKGYKHKQIRETLPLAQIQEYVDRFIDYAKQNPELQFQVTAIGCGLAGLKHEEVAPMFFEAPTNCWFDFAWTSYLGQHNRNYWGTF